MSMRRGLSALAVAAMGGGAYLVLRRRSTMSTVDLADFLAKRAPQHASYAYDVARAAIATAPRDYFAEDADEGLRRWALLLFAIADHESAAAGQDFGTAPGYQPPGDVAGWGDRGNAFGFFQIDRRYHWAFIQTDAAQTVYGQALYAAKLLAKNWRRFQGIEDANERERLAVITYNASLERVAMMIAAGASVDAADATTSKTADGTPYGIDVLSRVEEWS
jgi:hypothetical protein